MIENYPSPIKTTSCTNSTFSDSNHEHLNPVKDQGNLSADHIQSEITAKSWDPKLFHDFHNSVNSLLTGKERQDCTIVAKGCCTAIENPASESFEHSTGRCTSKDFREF